jgi:hypothetical protein
MDTLTLDTNLLRDWAWVENRVQEIRYNDDQTIKKRLQPLFLALQELRDSGVCELGITTQIFTDFEKDAGDLPSFINDMIGHHVNLSGPSIQTFPWMFPIVFADVDDISEILNDVFAGARPEHKKFGSYKKDALQLTAHKAAKRDYFLTSDKRILASRKVLLNKWGIVVMMLEEYINMKSK